MRKERLVLLLPLRAVFGFFMPPAKVSVLKPSHSTTGTSRLVVSLADLPRERRQLSSQAWHSTGSQNMSSDDESISNDETSSLMERKVKGRKKRVLLGYSLASVLYTTMSVLGLVKGGITPLSCFTVSGGPLLAATVAYILRGAARNNRLNSDTYKRLNLFLALYGGLGVATGVLIRQMNNYFWYIWMVASSITMVNSIKGYGYGVKGWELMGTMSNVKDDVVNGVKSTTKSMMVSIPSNLQSFTYLAATVTIGCLKVFKLIELIKLVSQGADLTLVVSRLSNYAKYALMTGVAFTLQDAAVRGRLDGTTFIELNFVSGVAYASMAAYLNASGAFGLARTIAFFSVMTTVNGFLGIFVKQTKVKPQS